ncbi:hypothetical protein HKCCE4037_05260 [Rhodobacterales bacterium HKCCE4037]|nr:hypothetical protein [Rhodobacterales bacterium HKCCE4037]
MRPFALFIAMSAAALTLPVVADTVATPIATGQFVDADQRHQGAGTATLAQSDDGRTFLQFVEDFAVTPGPDLEVWLVVDDAPATSAAVLESEYLSLGPLQSPEGAQTYEVPSSVIASDYGSVVIWCEDFSVLFSVATFTPATDS